MCSKTDSNNKSKDISNEGDALCVFPTCSNPAYCKGYCNGHYRQWLRLCKRKSFLPTTNDLKPLRGLTSRAGGCHVCGREVKATGLCNRHYTQVHVHGRLTPELERS